MQSVPLREYAVLYCRMVDGSSGYEKQLTWTVGFVEKFIGRPIGVHELTDEVIRDYVIANREKFAPQTLRSRRNMLLRLNQQAAFDPALADRPPAPRKQLCPKIRVGSPTVDAWTVAEVRRLLKTADELPGRFRNGMSRAGYWGTYIRAAWDSGLRGCDLRRLERHQINAEGRAAIRQQKTSRIVYAAFRPSTIERIDKFWTDDRRTIWPVVGGLSRWRRAAAALIAKAGLTGSIGKLRHSAGTSVELKHPGHGHHFLGNSADVFDKHYFARQMAAGVWWPDPIDESDFSRPDGSP